MDNKLTQNLIQKIYYIRGHRIMLDEDLADLYEVSAKRLNEQVRRNLFRFPEDFMFQLTVEEYDSLRSQNATLKLTRGRHRKYKPFAFTEQGVAMLSGVLRSERAVRVNIEIVRAFVHMRKWMIDNKDLVKRIDNLEKKYDSQFKMVFEAIREIMNPSEKTKRRKIGF